MRYYEWYDTDIGTLTLASEDGFVCGLYFGRRKLVGAVHEKTELTELAIAEVREYLSGKRRDFDLPLRTEGSAFQKDVWNALLTIPYGQTRSYKEIAEMIGNSKACRAVGTANHHNPISIIIPCHRVIGSDGGLTGYGGGLDTKERLLKLESGGV